jgi:hypothetical protein
VSGQYLPGPIGIGGRGRADDRYRGAKGSDGTSFQIDHHGMKLLLQMPLLDGST